jgi:hypothetical protein
VRIRQATLLGRAFFGRLFESDLMPPGHPQVHLLIMAITILGMPGLAVPMMYTPKYGRISFFPGVLGAAINTDRVMMITLCMIAMGFAALVIWEGVFPDRRDARILSPLPIDTATFVVARLGALGWLFCLFVAGTTVLPALMFSLIVSGFLPTPGIVRSVTSHVAALLLACAFAFYSLLALQCLLLALFGRAIVQRLTVLLQILFTVGLLQLLLFLPSLGARMGDGSLRPDWLSSGLAWWLPPVWFAGIYEVLSGYGGRSAYSLAATGLVVSVGSVVATVVLYAASYKRLTRRALETPPGRVRAGRGGRMRTEPGWLTGSSAVERAVFRFTLKTLVRSRQHRMLLAIYFAVGLAIVTASVVPMVVSGGRWLWKPSIPIGSAPLVLMFFMLAGMRGVFSIPVEPKANWAIRIREPLDRAAAIAGARRAMFLAGVLPIVMVSTAATAPLWGIVTAGRHGLFCLLLGALLIELLLLGFSKIPFTCTYHPATSRMRTRWPAYGVGFIFYAYFMTAVQFGALRGSTRFAIGCAVLVAATALVSWLRTRSLRDLAGLVFDEEDPEAVFEGFHLSEGVAVTRP